MIIGFVGGSSSMSPSSDLVNEGLLFIFWGGTLLTDFCLLLTDYSGIDKMFSLLRPLGLGLTMFCA